MRLTQRERERLLVHMAAELARKRRKDDVKLNYPEAVAIIADTMIEAARRGASYQEVLSEGREAVAAEETMEWVPEMIDSVDVEVRLREGTKFVSLREPFGP